MIPKEDIDIQITKKEKIAFTLVPSFTLLTGLSIVSLNIADYPPLNSDLMLILGLITIGIGSVSSILAALFFRQLMRLNLNTY